MTRKTFTLLVIWLVLISLNSTPFAESYAQKAEQKLSRACYIDPKGYFRIFPPEGWQIKKFPNDPRGKVAFIGPKPNMDLRILASVKDFSSFEELFEVDKENAKDIEKQFGLKVFIEKTTFLDRQAVKRSWTYGGVKFFAIDFMEGNIRHDLQYGAPSKYYDEYFHLVLMSMKTYEPIPQKESNKFKEHQLANKQRLAKLFLDLGNLELAMEYVENGLVIDPQNQELLKLKREIEAKHSEKSNAIKTKSSKNVPRTNEFIKLVKNKIIEIPSISEIVGKGEVVFEKGEKPNTFKMKINGVAKIINQKRSPCSMEIIRIAPNLKVPLDLFTESPVPKPEGIAYVIESEEYKNVEAEVTISPDDTEFIISGSKGAVLKKIGKGFLLIEGEAWLKK